jgi:hypothetical protein
MKKKTVALAMSLENFNINLIINRYNHHGEFKLV